MDEPDKDEMKRLYKEALKEWLDDKFAEVGKFSLKTILVAGLGALTIFVLWANGWQKPH